MRTLLRQDGMTVIEVLIAAIIFMAGFSTLILLMNSTLIKFSAREILQADNLAEEVMAKSLADQDTTSTDSVFEVAGVAYRVTRNVGIEPDLAGISVTVYRAKQSRKIVKLYDAFVIHK